MPGIKESNKYCGHGHFYATARAHIICIAVHTAVWFSPRYLLCNHQGLHHTLSREQQAALAALVAVGSAAALRRRRTATGGRRRLLRLARLLHRQFV